MTLTVSRPVRRPRPDVEVRVRLTITQEAAVTILVAQEDLADLEAVRRRAAQSIYDGDLTPEVNAVSIAPHLVYRIDARCKVQDRDARTPWCRIHDSPMRRDDASLCYGAPADGRLEHGR